MIQSLETKKFLIFKSVLLFVCVVIFSSSLFLPVFTTGKHDSKTWVNGLFCLFYGWVFVYDAGISWVANPLLIISWLLFFRRTKAARWLSVIALLFSVSFLLFDEINMQKDEIIEKITGIGIGYYLWLSSVTMTLISTSVIIALEKKEPFIHPHHLDPNPKSFVSE